MKEARLHFRFLDPVIINDEPITEERCADLEARHIPHPGRFGSQYPRMLFLRDGRVLCVYTVYRNKGYLADPDGGNSLVVSESTDNMKSFHELCEIRDPGRDMDNGMLLELDSGAILLACRSVRWQESYRLPVYESTDGGKTFHYLSMIDRNEGVPGELGEPDRGIYEPHMILLDDGAVAVLYANERYALAPHAYSQIISEKLSRDSGQTWGREITVCSDDEKPDARPGMPVLVRMHDKRYITVHEVVATENADIFCKFSEDGVHWEPGIGTRIADQRAGPFVEGLDGGAVVVTSNSHQLSISLDNGETFYTHDPAPWADVDGTVDERGHERAVSKSVWPSLYALPEGKMLFVTSMGRKNGGHNIVCRICEPV